MGLLHRVMVIVPFPEATRPNPLEKRRFRLRNIHYPACSAPSSFLCAFLNALNFIIVIE
jgi:hypothetical protein